ncbi:MAG: class I SAM-dependent methyltransferase [Planctomycetes bacterium]|nr:class I SAM-dependent methyltransferase [Planctomycetota bacterium]
MEAGSGTAFASSLFAECPKTFMSVCMDLDADALSEARRRDPALPAVVGDLMQMPFADGTFDLVFNSSTVEHMDDPVGVAGEMRRVCRDDGCVFVGVPYVWGPLGFQPIIRNTGVGVWLGRVFSRSSLDRFLREAGLTPVAHRRYFWNFFVGAVATKRLAPATPADKVEELCCQQS